MRRLALAALTVTALAATSSAHAHTPPTPPPDGSHAAPLQPAGTVTSARLKGRTLEVEVVCDRGTRPTVALTSGSVSIGTKRFRCRETRSLTFRSPRTLLRRAQRDGGVGLQARISAAGRAPSAVRLMVRRNSARSVARASANRIVCTWCTQLVFGGFGNTQTLEYWVRSAASPILSNGRWYWWADAQYYQNYAGGYVTTFRYWHYWNGTAWVHYQTVDIGP